MNLDELVKRVGVNNVGNTLEGYGSVHEGGTCPICKKELLLRVDAEDKRHLACESGCKVEDILAAFGLNAVALMEHIEYMPSIITTPPPNWDEPEKLVHGAGKYDQGEVAREEKKPSKTQAEILLELVTATGATFFRNETDDPYAALKVNDHTEILPLEGRDFSIWLNGLYYKETGKPVGIEAIKQAVAVLSAAARFDNPEPITLFTRVAERDGAFWYDLTNTAWQAVKVTAEGWTVCDNPPILFARYRHQAAQSVPQPGGDVKKILRYVNIKGVDTLFLCWLVACFVPDIPHPMPILYGEKGAAKSTASELLKRLIDPSALGTLTLQNDPRTLPVNFQQHWFLPFDNVSHVSEEISDMLCRAITGGGIQQRKLFTNAEDTIFTFIRCLALNGINNVATRPDLLDRSILVELDRIAEAERKELAEVKSAFEADRPAILGGILDTLSHAMKIFPSVKLDKLPRMADFARWGYAIGEALGSKGQEFLDQYAANRQEQNAEAINSDPVALLIVAFMGNRKEWTGLVSSLLMEMRTLAFHEGISTQTKAFPSQPNGLSRRLRGMKSNLEGVGILCEIERGMRGAVASMRWAKSSSLPSLSSQPNKINGFSYDDQMTMYDDKIPSSSLSSSTKGL